MGGTNYVQLMVDPISRRIGGSELHIRLQFAGICEKASTLVGSRSKGSQI
jgi:hypothetical protein